jgi:hypothetical protein
MICKCLNDYLSLENGLCEKCGNKPDKLSKKICDFLIETFSHSQNKKTNDYFGYAKTLVRIINNE